MNTRAQPDSFPLVFVLVGPAQSVSRPSLTFSRASTAVTDAGDGRPTRRTDARCRRRRPRARPHRPPSRVGGDDASIARRPSAELETSPTSRPRPLATMRGRGDRDDARMRRPRRLPRRPARWRRVSAWVSSPARRRRRAVSCCSSRSTRSRRVRRRERWARG